MFLMSDYIIISFWFNPLIYVLSLYESEKYLQCVLLTSEPNEFFTCYRLNYNHKTFHLFAQISMYVNDLLFTKRSELNSLHNVHHS